MCGDYGVNLRPESFDKQMDWLCQGEFILFVVDPYYYDRDAKSALRGRFGKKHLFQLFESLSRKKGAILLIFTADPTDSSRKTYEELKHDINNYSDIPLVRHYLLVDKQLENEALFNYYWVSVVGFGNGVNIVNDLPNSDQWNASLIQSGVFMDVYGTRIEEVIC
jgi:hypothetical protein